MDELVAELTIAYIVTKLKQHKVVLLAYDYGPDHIHIFISNVRFIGEVELVRQIKGYSAFMMRRGHGYMFKDKLWGKKFWSEGHFYRSVGAVTKDTMQHYIEECQDKHWEKPNDQKSLIEF